MSSDVTEPQPSPAAPNEQAEALLNTANSGSQHVAVLHVAFMVLCAYVLVIVFGTTDMDLLIGKGVKLPVVDVTVPIVGFYAFAPYLVVLVHFNLLLQLQLLSRQLYAFDAAAARLILPNFIHPSVHAAPKEEGIGGLRDRLHIFPYTYYLVGRPGPIVRWLLGFVVGITLLVLPLATLLVLQLRFLAYQDQTVTWWQRVAVWIDVALVIALWPLIMDRGDSWRRYLRRLVIRLDQRWRIGLAWAVVWGIVFLTFITTTPFELVETGKNTFQLTATPASAYVGYFSALGAILGLLILLGVARGLTGLWRRWRGRRRKPEGTGPAVRGMPGLLLVVALGAPLPLALFALGEWWEKVLLMGNVAERDLMVYDRFRSLDLSEQVLLAKPAKPELIAPFRAGNPEKVKEALKQVEPVNLRGRNLRGAHLFLALLPGADLRESNLQGANLVTANLQGAHLEIADLQGAYLGDANLQGAYLDGARLQGAQLTGANLQGADLGAAQLQGTVLSGARLQGAQLWGAGLQGAYLTDARLQGADLTAAKLQVADLKGANLQGADLTNAELQAADLQRAKLQGADLTNAGLQGADLRFAGLYGVIIETGRTGLVDVETSGTALVDLRAASWTPLHEERLAEIRKVLGKTVADKNLREKALDRIERAGHADLAPPTLESCLIDPEVTPELNCEQKWLPAEKEAFQRELFPVLEKLACHSAEIAQALTWQSQCCEYGDARDTTSGRFGLAGRFAALLHKRDCEGLGSLPETDKNGIRDLARREEELRAQSSAGKPAGEVSASPTLPPAITPETP